MPTLLTLLRLPDESKVAGRRGVSRVGAKSGLVVVETFSLYWCLNYALTPFFYPILLRAGTE